MTRKGNIFASFDFFIHSFKPYHVEMLKLNVLNNRHSAQVVGNIIRMDEGEELPCDVVILSSSLANGEAYITTANLDGETNLKVSSLIHCSIAGDNYFHTICI